MVQRVILFFSGTSNFAHQHAIEIQSNGNILIFDNGNHKSSEVSRALEFSFNTTTWTVNSVWEHPLVFYSSAMGDADKLPNGNVLITNSINRTILEVTPSKAVAWRITVANTNMYRSMRLNSLY